MDDIVYEPKNSLSENTVYDILPYQSNMPEVLPRKKKKQLPSHTRKRTNRNKREKGGYVQRFVVKTVWRVLICTGIFFVALLSLEVPQAVSLYDKIKKNLVYDNAIDTPFDKIREMLKVATNNTSQEITDVAVQDIEHDISKNAEPISWIYTDESFFPNQSTNEPKTEETSQQIFGNSEYSFLIPVGGIIGSFYGERLHPIKNTIQFHKGIDIEAKSGTPIMAAYDGKVLEAGVEESYGNYIKLEHEAGLTSLYAHCSKLLVAEGETVKKGSIIAEVGATGAANGPHLHFEVRKGNTAVNPLDYIALPDND